MTDDQIIEAAIQGHASTRDAIRWAIGQVREQSNTHQSPSVSAPNTHKPDAVVRQLVEALGKSAKYLGGDTTRNNETDKTALAEIHAALAAAQEAGL